MTSSHELSDPTAANNVDELVTTATDGCPESVTFVNAYDSDDVCDEDPSLV